MTQHAPNYVAALEYWIGDENLHLILKFNLILVFTYLYLYLKVKVLLEESNVILYM